MILASQSPRRAQLLAEAGFAFRAVPSPFDERLVTCPTPHDLVAALARGKAAAVASQEGNEEMVIGSDTVVVLDGTVLGKPVDAQDAWRMLRGLSGRSHQVMTAVCLMHGNTELETFTECARVTFWPLSDGEIERYVASGEPFDKAGAYGIQGKGRMLVKGIEGDFYTVVGLPISRLARELARFGVYPAD